MNTLKVAVRGPLKLIGILENAEPMVEFTLAETPAMEDELGRPMKTYLDWVRIQAKELPVLLRYGLKHHHTDAAEALAEDICKMAYPELQEQIIEAIVGHAWPDTTQKVAEQLEKMKANPKNG